MSSPRSGSAAGPWWTGTRPGERSGGRATISWRGCSSHTMMVVTPNRSPSHRTDTERMSRMSLFRREFRLTALATSGG